jgi:endonuclease YncB( thermonuclease family)
MNPAVVAAPLTPYPARIERVIDGDTVVARLDLGLGVELLQHVQLFGVNAPERPTEAGQQALAYVQDRLLHRQVTLSVNPQRPRDAFGRVLAMISLDGSNFNQELIDHGHAVAYRRQR